jgi:FMN phosphatase YigB (HAD superfamily)
MSGSGVEKAKFKIYEKILHDLKVLPSECLVVGNTLQDLLPALNLGMKVVGTKGSYRTDPALRDSVEILEDLSDLVKLLQLNCYGGKHPCVF